MKSSLNVAISQNAGTFCADKKLPKLPIPNLTSTFTLYLSSVKAFYSDTDDIVIKIQEFIHSTEAILLQNELTSRYNSSQNWLEKIWLEETYFKARDPLVPCWNISSISKLHESVWPLIDQDAIGSQLFHPDVINRAANYIAGILKFYFCLRNQYVEPSLSRNKRDLSMYQLHFVFNTCRIPMKNMDELYSGFQLASHGKSLGHITVACKGKIFLLNVIDGEENMCSVESLEMALSEIINECESSDPGPFLASLTSLPRDKWADTRKMLMDFSRENEAGLNKIEQSLFWLCLSTEQPPHPHVYFEKAMKVDCRNTWADKSFYVNVMSNGLITWGADHASVDTIALNTLVSFVEDIIKEGNGDVTNIDLPLLKSFTSNFEPRWEKINFNIPQRVTQLINMARNEYVERCKNLEAQVFTYHSFCREFVRYIHYHPDTVFQLCLQLAYVKLYGIENIATVYETSTTRKFRRGRTETIRSCTFQAVEWIKAMLELGPGNKRTAELFAIAHKTHNDLRSRCENGGGCDRHLLALVTLSNNFEELNSPLLNDIIKDETWSKTGSDKSFMLSTSPIGSSDFIGIVAPMNKKGYGVFYRIMETYCEVGVTCFRSEVSHSSSDLIEEINKCFGFLPTLFKSVAKFLNAKL